MDAFWIGLAVFWVLLLGVVVPAIMGGSGSTRSGGCGQTALGLMLLALFFVAGVIGFSILSQAWTP